MNIEKDKVVSFHYQLTDVDQNQQIEDSTGQQPMLYLHGHNNLFPDLEQALAGKSTGDEVSCKLSPEQAYGPRRDDAVQRISVKHIHTQNFAPA